MDVQKIHKWNIVGRHKQSLYLKAKPENGHPLSMWSDPPLILPKTSLQRRNKKKI